MTLLQIPKISYGPVTPRHLGTPTTCVHTHSPTCTHMHSLLPCAHIYTHMLRHTYMRTCTCVYTHTSSLPPGNSPVPKLERRGVWGRVRAELTGRVSHTVKPAGSKGGSSPPSALWSVQPLLAAGSGIPEPFCFGATPGWLEVDLGVRASSLFEAPCLDPITVGPHKHQQVWVCWG